MITDCENAQLVSVLNSEDSGTVNIGQVFTNGFPTYLVNVAFGQDLTSDELRTKMMPIGTGSKWGGRDCLRQCGMEESPSRSDAGMTTQIQCRSSTTKRGLNTSKKYYLAVYSTGLNTTGI
jgi:hypothetical protein